MYFLNIGIYYLDGNKKGSRGHFARLRNSTNKLEESYHSTQTNFINFQSLVVNQVVPE